MDAMDGQTLRKPRRGDELEVAITHFDARGRAVGSASDASGEYQAHVTLGIPGERVRMRVRRRRGQRLEGDPVARLEPSPRAVEPACAHFGTCGGCSFQNLEYATQLEHKRALVVGALSAAGLDPPVEPVLPCPPLDPAGGTPYGYRNKMDFTFANRRWVEEHEPEGVERDFALGLHVRGVWGKVLDVSSCAIAFPAASAILTSVRELALERGLEPWDTRAHSGLLRHLLVRQARSTGQILVDLVTSRDAPELIEPLARSLVERHPQITTVVQNVTARAAQVAVGEYERVLSGPGTIVERIAPRGADGALDDGPPLEFEISANSFFQTNTRQAEALLGLVREAAQPSPDDLVWDVYCGAGFFALALARCCRAVLGFEWVEDAVRDAERNARRNGIENASFVAGDLSRILRADGLDASWGRPDVCIIDPPRAGAHPSVTDTLLELRPRRIVWVSCNLEAAAADLARLVQGGYRVTRVQPVDLFPHTPHVETVVLLERTELAQPGAGSGPDAGRGIGS